MFKRILLILTWFFAAFFCYGQSNFSRGEELLMHNRPSEAVVFLERAAAEESSRATAWLYLGIVYEQLGRLDDAISAYRRALPLAGDLSANVANNLGNVYFLKGDIAEAERSYTQAIGFDPSFSRAYLGRANTRLRDGNLQNAIADYEQYLRLEPLTSRFSNIEQLMTFIRTEAASEEMRRLTAEEEERRLAVERQSLLELVSASLQSAADHSSAMSIGAENVEIYEGEFILE